MAYGLLGKVLERRCMHTMRIKRNQGGFTLIELLIVVAIIGIIAAIGIPNLLNAVDRAKQKRTMADIRAIGTAVESYAVDANNYPRGVTTLTNVTSSVELHISPSFIRDAPVFWRRSPGATYASRPRIGLTSPARHAL